MSAQKEFDKLSKRARGLVADATKQFDESGVKERAEAAFNTAAEGAQRSWDATKLAFWTARIGREDAQKTMDILAQGEPLFAELEKQVQALPQGDVFFTELQKRLDKGIDSPFKERRGGRNSRLAAAAVIKNAAEGADVSAYEGIKDTATKVENLYKGLPASYVNATISDDQKKEQLQATAQEYGEKALEAGKKQWASWRTKLGL